MSISLLDLDQITSDSNNHSLDLFVFFFLFLLNTVVWCKVQIHSLLFLINLILLSLFLFEDAFVKEP